MAQSLAIRARGGPRTWTVIDGRHQTVGPVEDGLEAHRYLWSPNTVRGYATALTQWWSFLEQRGETGQWSEVGVQRWRRSCRGCATSAQSSTRWSRPPRVPHP